MSFGDIHSLAAFPSPCGEKVGINGGNHVLWGHPLAGCVSVPLRGKGRDQQYYKTYSYFGDNDDVSVPLRGKGRDQRPGPAGGSGPGPDVSVPLRGKGRDQLQRSLEMAPRCIVSVPLRGKGRDQRIETRRESRNRTWLVSVPLRGKGRDQPSTVDLEREVTGGGFRPLAGKR